MKIRFRPCVITNLADQGSFCYTKAEKVRHYTTEANNLQVAGLTNRGKERARNEDSYFLQTGPAIALIVVADGMGGHRAGNVASGLAVSTAEKYWNELLSKPSLAEEKSRELIKGFILEANEMILNEASSSPALQGMGTTLTAGLICHNRLTIGHIGDSRAYQINGDTIKLLTRDHSLIEQLVQSGQVKPEDAQNHPKRHVLTRALGTVDDPEIDLTEVEIETGSALVFCTDGLTNMVCADEILALFHEMPDPEKLAQSLIDLANERGGFDNITVVIATDIGGNEA
jgi:PPM family protein phosphatase